MPLDIEMNDNMPKTFSRFSRNVELIAALHLLADSKHHQFAQDWVNTLYNSLSESAVKTLSVFSNTRLHGLELMEFVLKGRIFDDTEELIKSLAVHDDVDFIFTFIGEEIDMERIQKIKSNKKELELLVEELPYLIHGNLKGLEYLFYHTSSLKEETINLVKELNNTMLDNKIEALKEYYERSIEDINEQIKEKSPAALAEEIMGRRCKKLNGLTEHYFVPSYFISPHRIRFFNKTAQLIIYDIGKSKIIINETGDRVSAALKVISDRTRLEILKHLLFGTTYGKILADRLDLTTATISHHLEQLKSVELVKEERVKNIKYFSANIEKIDELFDECRNYLFNKL